MRRVGALSPLDAEASARLVGAADRDEFGTALLEIARSIAGIDEVFAYIVRDDGDPDVLVSQSVLDGVRERVSLYTNRFYRHDPAVRDIREIAPGDSFVQRISLRSIIPHDYRLHCFTEPGFAEKLTFGWRGEGYVLVASFYSANEPDREALGKLASLANLTLAALVRQHSPVDRNNAAKTIDARLRRSFPALSDREREVCALTIIGWSASKIAVKLAVSAGTVLTYRQRAYQKTGVASAMELVPSVLH
ncbi:helix-turn-helix transcriptional regulator [Sphingobium fluviale]|uniref:LuxR family transcriptional regulator n=1 Tax=Sphingobium fluviale TaxID=2506423 RepID=A0A4Q1KL85_9SPHN|nr:helix-turn-helix transcriptional regulator [Sphingobium fluviale]RXR30482.1 LuxR family transcriptional regulator [Sphingobium fluviale]